MPTQVSKMSRIDMNGWLPDSLAYQASANSSQERELISLLTRYLVFFKPCIIFHFTIFSGTLICIWLSIQEHAKCQF